MSLGDKQHDDRRRIRLLHGNRSILSQLNDSSANRAHGLEGAWNCAARSTPICNVRIVWRCSYPLGKSGKACNVSDGA